jgi:hypothetical protein
MGGSLYSRGKSVPGGLERRGSRSALPVWVAGLGCGSAGREGGRGGPGRGVQEKRSVQCFWVSEL